MSVMTYTLNVIFVRIGENVVTAYGLYYKIQQFILFCAFGLRDAITPIVSFNYGMRNKKRVKEGIRFGMLDTLKIMIAGLVLIEIFANPLSAFLDYGRNTAVMHQCNENRIHKFYFCRNQHCLSGNLSGIGFRIGIFGDITFETGGYYITSCLCICKNCNR